MIYLPECFQVNDTKRPKPSKIINRHELGLPEQGFIYACFNNRLKLTPAIFTAWLKILKSTTNTFLWDFVKVSSVR
jgi:predicted O-linked N-acetylglucosamine transferase (SPINDLY family)